MKSGSHDRRMADVYSHIYNAFYNFEDNALKQAISMIEKNLRELGVALETLPRLSVLNIGTGREIYAFHKLGAGPLYHFDVSNRSVSRLQELSRNEGFGNIHSKQADVCADDALGLRDAVDVVYLNGVLHHLHAAGIATENIIQSLKPGARIFFRIYRSGSLGFFVVDFIRKIIRYDDFELTTKVAEEQFGNTDDPAGAYADVVDDFFVPVLKLYDPRAIDSYFTRSGFRVLLPRDFPEYDHSNTGADGQGWSLYYEYLDLKTVPALAGEFPGHVDQLHGINYKELYINKTVAMMDRVLERSADLPARVRVDLALTLYAASQTYRRQQGGSANDNHRQLQEILATVF